MAVHRMSVALAHALLIEGRALFIDTRSPGVWATADEQIPGALRLSVAEAKLGVDRVPQADSLIAYCTEEEEAASERVARALVEAGYERCFCLRGGFTSWIESGLPTEPKGGAAHAPTLASAKPPTIAFCRARF